MSKDSTLYAGSFEINSSKDEMYHFANGYIDIEQGHVKAYCYYVKDHLGNVRHVDMANPRTNRNEIVQVNNYYPFGGVIDEGSRRGADVQNHLYNGKEYDPMHGLNLYDYSARQYDAAIGQFTSMDPLCEKYYHISPYAYCAGNPVKYVDPDGKAFKIVYADMKGKRQTFIFRDTGNRKYYVVPKSRNNFGRNVVKSYVYNKSKWIKAGNRTKSSMIKLGTSKTKNVYVIETKGGKSFDPKYQESYNVVYNNAILWNADYGIKTNNGTCLSPATGFSHECAHAWDYFTDSNYENNSK